MHKPKVWLVALTAASFGWLAGHVGASTATAQPMYDHLALFAEVLGHIQNRYVDEVDEALVIEAAIDGMLGELDPHSTYMNPEEYEAMKNDTRGEYVGVGIVIHELDDGVFVQEVFDGGPAALAGVLAGDLLVSIDGVSAEGFETSDVVHLLRGRRGETVDVVVGRTDEAGLRSDLPLQITRDVIEMEAVVEEQPIPGYGVVRVRQFQNDVSDDIRAAIDRMQDDYGAQLRGLVLDLRGNPGGLLAEAIAVSDVFLSEGEIVSTGGRAQPTNRWSASRSSTRFSGPLILLVDGGSASASEIVAGAIQDNERAPILGVQSYGKGSVQTIIDLSGGSGLKLTISLYYTPSGRSIHGEGITPDIWVDAFEVDPSSAEPVAGHALPDMTDGQLREALRLLAESDMAPVSLDPDQVLEREFEGVDLSGGDVPELDAAE